MCYKVLRHLACKSNENKDNNNETLGDAIKQASTTLNKDSISSQRLVNLLSTVDDSFRISWSEISCIDLRYRHTPESCEAIWKVYLQPSLKRTPWTYEENVNLLKAVKRYKFQDWESIASCVDKRSDFQVIYFFSSLIFKYLISIL